MLTITAIPAFSDNYIWCISDSTTKTALIVDPGQAAPVEEFLGNNELRLDTVLITHHHPDHVGGVKSLKDSWPECRIVAPKASPFQNATEQVEAGAKVQWHNLQFTVFAVPGHTLDHIAYFSEQEVSGRPVLFCGDTLFVCGCGRLFEGTPAQMRASLESLRSLPGQTAVYCAHEYTLANLRFARHWLPDDQALKAFESECENKRQAGEFTVPSTLDVEKKLNPFLRWDDPAVISAAEHYCADQGLASDSADAIFAAIRHGKDNF